MPHSKDAVGSTAAEAEDVKPATPATSVPEPLDNTADELPGIYEKRKPARESGLRNKVVVITGAGAGIGRATALAFASFWCRASAMASATTAFTMRSSCRTSRAIVRSASDSRGCVARRERDMISRRSAISIKRSSRRLSFSPFLQ